MNLIENYRFKKEVVEFIKHKINNNFIDKKITSNNDLEFLKINKYFACYDKFKDKYLLIFFKSKGNNECILASHTSKELIEKTSIKLITYFEDTGFIIYTKTKSDLDKSFFEIVSTENVYTIIVKWNEEFKDKVYNNEYQKQTTELKPIIATQENQTQTQIQNIQIQNTQIQKDNIKNINLDDEFIIEN